MLAAARHGLLENHLAMAAVTSPCLLALPPTTKDPRLAMLPRITDAGLMRWT